MDIDLHYALTAAGKVLCMSLGLANPTHETCQEALARSQPTCDMRFNCPVTNGSSPDHQAGTYAADPNCVKWGTYKVYDGTPGGEWYCRYKASIFFVPGTASWYWDVDRSKPADVKPAK